MVGRGSHDKGGRTGCLHAASPPSYPAPLSPPSLSAPPPPSPLSFGGQITGFDESIGAYIDKKNARRQDDCLKYALVAGKKSLEDAGLGTAEKVCVWGGDMGAGDFLPCCPRGGRGYGADLTAPSRLPSPPLSASLAR